MRSPAQEYILRVLERNGQIVQIAEHYFLRGGDYQPQVYQAIQPRTVAALARDGAIIYHATPADPVVAGFYLKGEPV